MRSSTSYMFADGARPLETLRVRVNVTCAGTLLALSEHGAIVQLPIAQRPERQTTLAIEDHKGDTVYIPARVVRTEPSDRLPIDPIEYRVAVEFFGLSHQIIGALRGLVERHETRRPSNPAVPACDSARMAYA